MIIKNLLKFLFIIYERFFIVFVISIFQFVTCSKPYKSLLWTSETFLCFMKLISNVIEIYMKKIVQIYSKLILFWRSSSHEFKYIRSFSNEHLVQKIWIIRNMRMKIKCMSSVWGERMHACTVLSLSSIKADYVCLTQVHVFMYYHSSIW